MTDHAQKAEKQAKSRGVRRTANPSAVAVAPMKSIEPQTLNIFISHKSKDEAAARLLKQQLEDCCRKITLFLSCDSKALHHGSQWREAIHAALDQADWLIMIYTTPGDNWDWCLYEAGYFAGRRGVERTQSLLVLHPPGVKPPAPLDAWQSVAADPKKLLGYFQSIFRVGDPLCHFIGDHKQMKQLAEAICDAIAPLRECSFSPNRSLTIRVPAAAPNSSEILEDLPAKTTVQLDQRTAELLGLAQDAAYPWKKFKAESRRFNFDTEKLIETVSMARTLRAVPDSLRVFRAPHDGRGYRPLVYAVTRQDSGGVEVQLMLAPLPPTVTPENLNNFERVIAILGLAKQFRREVSEAYGTQLAEIDRSTNEKERLKFLRSIRFSIEQVSADARNQGFGNPETLPDAFDAAQYDQIRDLQAKWKSCFEALKTAVDDGRSDIRPSDLLNPMRAVNLAFLRLALCRLQTLAARFRLPDLTKVPQPYCNWIPQSVLADGDGRPASDHEPMPEHRDMPVPAKAPENLRSKPSASPAKGRARRH